MASCFCHAVTQQEFIEYIGKQGYYTGLSHGYIFYPNGTGLYQGSPMGLYGDLMGALGGGNISLSHQGAKAQCYYSCDIEITWKITNSKLIMSYKRLHGKPITKIVEWQTSCTQSQVNGIEKKLRQMLAEDKAKIGKTETYIFDEAKGPKCFAPAYVSDLERAFSWCCGGSLDGGYSSSSSSSGSSSYTVKEPVVVEATYPEGEYSIKNYVAKKLTYPAHLRKSGYSKTASYTLTISPDGQVSDAWSSDDVDSKLERSTKQLLMNLPKRFTPKTIDGQKVEGQYSVKISYYTGPAIEFDVQKVTFRYTGGEARVSVSSNQNWELGDNTSSNFTSRREGDYIIISCPERNKYDYDQISDKLKVYTADKSISYDIKIYQEGAPKPYIKASETSVVLPHNKKYARATVDISSNRDWQIVNLTPESKIIAQRTGEKVTITAPTNRKKIGDDATFSIESVDKDCHANIYVHQNSKAEDKEENQSKTYAHKSAGIGLWGDYYDNYGSFELGLVDVQVGAGCTLPIFTVENGEKVLTTEPYIPLNFEVGYLRFHFIELSLLNFRLDLSTDGMEGFAWEPQVRGLIPVSERWALMPYVGPVCQIDVDGHENTVWSASGGLMARVRYGRATHTNFSIGYKGGPYGGLAVGVSIGWSLGW